MKRIKMTSIFLCAFLAFSSCEKSNPVNDPVTYGASYVLTIHTDKAVYKPGDEINFTLSQPLAGNIKIRYRHGAETIKEETLNGTTWRWTAPAADFKGYMIDLYEITDGREKIHTSVAVDVSSDWSRFPRYGFVASFGKMSTADIGKVIKNLNRHHINGVQFQDWHYKHHMPLAGTPEAPLSLYKDIANRDTYASTIKNYIDAIHGYNMKAIFYNLAYGALSDGGSDGVGEEWYAFKDKNHTTKDVLNLPRPMFKSDIYILNPANTQWQQYIAKRNKDVYAAYAFDGYQIDQLGNRGTLYDYSGNNLDMAGTFKPFIDAMKIAAPDKRLVMNAVTQYGGQPIAQSPVDFLYSEVWTPNESFKDLAGIIQDNDRWSNNTKKTVLAAYMNYNVADGKGFFNTPGVLLMDAVTFAFGASHLELGEHMLGKEYFPNDNLEMKDDLKQAMVRYYDFLVAYENLLRDGGAFNNPVVSCTNGKLAVNAWPPASGQVAVIGREVSNSQVLHLVNFTNANSLNWRDADGTQPAPAVISNADLDVTVNKPVAKVWIASPDNGFGVATSLPFRQTGNTVSFTLPSLQYWDMVVVTYK
ncbi:glycoside hydrolase family 66 protein [Chitinophaga sp. 212800010-3]|uniref:glycoside hydrolase family 66 protein n=1 Tax=unclassified Chitinophaga TaxID=2619133 RepID=UPI002DF33B20|nr:Dextranase [Chitinophaga sp. 212800010-3]